MKKLDKTSGLPVNPIESIESVEASLQLSRMSDVLVCGSKLYTKPDRRLLYKQAIGIDFQDGDGVDIVHDLHDPLDMKFSNIDCVSVLEHVKNPFLAAVNIQNALKDKGTLLLSVPFVWRQHGYPSDYWRFTPEAVRVLFPEIKWKFLRYFSYGNPYGTVRSFVKGDMSFLVRTEVIGFGRKSV